MIGSEYSCGALADNVGIRQLFANSKAPFRDIGCQGEPISLTNYVLKFARIVPIDRIVEYLPQKRCKAVRCQLCERQREAGIFFRYSRSHPWLLKSYGNGHLRDALSKRLPMIALLGTGPICLGSSWPPIERTSCVSLCLARPATIVRKTSARPFIIVPIDA